MVGFNQPSMYAAAVVLPCLATTAVGLRFYVRSMKGATIRLDDWTILLALILTWFLGIIVIVGTAMKALGIHTAINPVTGEDILTIHEVNDSRIVFVFLLVMILDFGIIKLSVLLMYMRIFVGKTFRIVSYSMCCLISVWALSFFFTTAFQCGVHASAWWTSAQSIQRYCIRYQALQLGHAVSDVVTDVMVLAIPAPIVWRLQMSVIEKIIVTAIFALGLFSTAAASVRLHSVYHDQYETRTGYRDLIGITSVIVLWSMVEAGIAIIAACLPTLRPLFQGHSPESVLERIRSALSLPSSASSESSSRSQRPPVHAVRSNDACSSQHEHCCRTSDDKYGAQCRESDVESEAGRTLVDRQEQLK